MGTCIAVSDGSFDPKEEKGSAAWVLESNDGSQSISGFSLIPNNEETKGSYRNELGGLLAIVHMVVWLEKNYGLQEGQVHIGCDGLTILKTAFFKSLQSQSCKKQHRNILSPISHLLSITKIKFCPFHVKGHQDNVFSFHSLSREEKMNV